MRALVVAALGVGSFLGPTVLTVLRAQPSPAAPVNWGLLRESTDNTDRTELIHQLPSRVSASVVSERLMQEPDVSVRRALILSLGGYAADQLSDDQRANLTSKLREWYREDPDAGVHSAIEWLLRHRWQAVESITELNGRPSEPASGRKWFTTPEWHTMAVIAGPVAFLMGSPASEPGRVPATDSPNEPLRRIRVPRSFAIATKEVTVAQFQRFLEANPAIRQRFVYPDNPNRMQHVLARFSPEPEAPQIAVTWYEAAMYCNWLSKQEGLAQSEWVYPENIGPGMRMPANHLSRRGYRLPTEAEWEFAARAGTTTSRFLGVDERLLDRFAWYSKNPPRRRGDPVDPRDPQRTLPAGRLKPNDFGLFDVYGNVWEWVHDRLQELPTTVNTVDDVEDSVSEVSDAHARVRRGGGFPYEAAMMRSAARGTRTAFPYLRRDNVGFRVARTTKIS